MSKTNVRKYSRPRKGDRVKNHSRNKKRKKDSDKYEGIPKEYQALDPSGQLAIGNASGKQLDDIQRSLPWYDSIKGGKKLNQKATKPLRKKETKQAVGQYNEAKQTSESQGSPAKE